MQKITPFLWFNGNAEEAIQFYAAIFKDSKTTSMLRVDTNGGPTPEGTLLTATFELAGQQFIALNGGPQFTFNEAVSFFISCDTQDEVDMYWSKLSAGGSTGQCGWLKDKFGLSWQVVPVALGKMLADPDAAKAARVLQAMLTMEKLDIAALEKAYEG